jgi:hypothetical protein
MLGQTMRPTARVSKKFKGGEGFFLFFSDIQMEALKRFRVVLA